MGRASRASRPLSNSPPLSSQTNQPRGALVSTHAEALAGYATAWDAFEKEVSGTRDDQGKLSMTSLDNAEEVVAAFDESLAAADAIERASFRPLADDATAEQLTADTRAIADATREVTRATQQLEQSSALFQESHQRMESQNLANMIADAEALFAEFPELKADGVGLELAEALAAARALAEDPKAHPTELRHAAQDLVTLTGQARAAAGPDPADISGHWAADVLVQTGGSTDLYARSGEIGQNEATLREALNGESNIVYTDPGWAPQDGCLVATVGSVGRHSQLWYCPAGVSVPAEAHAKVLTFSANMDPVDRQVEDVTRDRLIGSWILYRD